VDKDRFIEEYRANGENGGKAIITAGLAGTYSGNRDYSI